MNIWRNKNRKGDKIYFYYDYGRNPGQRISTGMYIFTHPKNQSQRDYNRETMALLEVKKLQKTIEQHAIGTPYTPTHHMNANFLQYYQEYVTMNRRTNNRHLINSLQQFRLFINKDFISPTEITENLCKRFRQFLLDKYTGETPGNYYTRFKWVLNAATSDGYFIKNPTEKIRSKFNPSIRMKNHLEADEYLRLLQVPCKIEQIKNAFLFSCYTGLRWVDVKRLSWSSIGSGQLMTRIIQRKTGQPVILTLHPVAKAILDRQKQQAHKRTKLVFKLPCADMANKIIQQWLETAGIHKHITWSCARLSFSILLQDQKVDDATVSYLLGHTTTEHVQRTYKRHRPKNQEQVIHLLPGLSPKPGEHH